MRDADWVAGRATGSPHKSEAFESNNNSNFSIIEWGIGVDDDDGRQRITRKLFFPPIPQRAGAVGSSESLTRERERETTTCVLWNINESKSPPRPSSSITEKRERERRGRIWTRIQLCATFSRPPRSCNGSRAVVRLLNRPCCCRETLFRKLK